MIDRKIKQVWFANRVNIIGHASGHVAVPCVMADAGWYILLREHPFSGVVVKSPDSSAEHYVPMANITTIIFEPTVSVISRPDHVPGVKHSGFQAWLPEQAVGESAPKKKGTDPRKKTSKQPTKKVVKK